MNHILEMIREYKDYFYLVTFIWTMLEGETFVIFAGVASAHHHLRLDLLILFAWLGSFAGDQIAFWVGRKFGKAIFRRYPKMQKGRNLVLGWIEKHSTGFILSYRFMYGLRNISALAIGMSEIPWNRFAKLNLAGALVWAVSFAGGGYMFGDLMGPTIEDSAVGFTMTIVLLFAIILGLRYAINRLRTQQEKLDGVSEDMEPAPLAGETTPTSSRDSASDL